MRKERIQGEFTPDMIVYHNRPGLLKDPAFRNPFCCRSRPRFPLSIC